MPAMLEDPTAPVIYRSSGVMPYPNPGGALPVGILPRQITLRDRVTTATLIPFANPAQVPITLLAYLSDQLNREIEKGDTYPMDQRMPLEAFGPYWFGLFGAVMLLGEIHSVEEVHEMASMGRDWEKECLGSFYIKPNYPGRSSHVCNGGFLVTDGARNRGVGRLMGETYLEWAPKLGYTYSVFNLVYETNVVSCKIWDALGFKRIGRVKGAGNLKSYPGDFVDAIIYGRDLGQDEDMVSEERFDKIRFYLKNGKYPNGADRAEKSRLRSAATHYKLVPAQGDEPEKLVLKGKEVIPDTQRQYEIARAVHLKSHGGINKTTAAIAERYHWVRIKETVSQVIRNCSECSEMNKGMTTMRVERRLPTSPPGPVHPLPPNPNAPINYQDKPHDRSPSPSEQLHMEAAQQSGQQHLNSNNNYNHKNHHNSNKNNNNNISPYSYEMPVDPALMDGIRHTTTNLEDLPPSPFLTAGRTLHMAQPIPDLDLSASPRHVPVARMTGDTHMSGTGERITRPTSAGAELRRRLVNAGYEGK
ncbi:hypothetical protein GQ43DRAFT_404837 [Delitschia confertaspora ATCC 74209]|uniref:N-acetyltransferase domain-containing protein n=1 Tax=Delitschia confertaspora ATCC 74209 TaxID=1513339 RepID=A0A9P4JE00_9PLEO|nr:hypothetical protein GQ43DRAFT_404837 [Delitschia confertaspora ATCC 74209]